MSFLYVIQDWERMLTDAGFRDIRIEPKGDSGRFIKDGSPGSALEDLVPSANITARKP